MKNYGFNRISSPALLFYCSDKGFTLIELLVVIIILGILAAIAIPNVMSQIGKGREGEAKSLIGALNRGQQAYFYENGAFSPGTDPKDYLEMPLGQLKYYDLVQVVPSQGVQYAHNNDNDQNNTRDYVGGVQYAQDAQGFATIVCRGNKGVTVDSDATAIAQLNSQYGVQATQAPLACASTSVELR